MTQACRNARKAGEAPDVERGHDAVTGPDAAGGHDAVTGPVAAAGHDAETGPGAACGPNAAGGQEAPSGASTTAPVPTAPVPTAPVPADDGQARALAVARAAARALAAGLAQGPSVLHYLQSTHGAADPAALAALLHDRQDADTATLAALLLSPGPEVLQALEPTLAQADLSGELALAAGRELARLSLRACIVLPGGQRLDVAFDQDDAAAFMARLRPQATAPHELRQALDSLPQDQASAMASAMRHSGLAWTQARRFFARNMLEGLAPFGQRAQEALDWALGFMSAAPPKAELEQALGLRRQELSAQLARALDFEEAFAKSNFETMVMQGARPIHQHVPTLRRELALLDMVAAACGVDAGLGAAVLEHDLGCFQDAESLLAALGRGEG